MAVLQSSSFPKTAVDSLRKQADGIYCTVPGEPLCQFDTSARLSMQSKLISQIFRSVFQCAVTCRPAGLLHAQKLSLVLR